MRYSEPCGHRGFTPPGVWAAYRCCLYPYGSQARLRLKLAARGRGPGTAVPRPPTTPCPCSTCSALTRRPTGLARVARCAPKSPRANIQRLNISFSTTVSRWYCAARREASAVGGKAALRMKTAAISPERCEGSSRSKCRAAPCSSRCDAGALAVGELVSRNTASP